VASLKAGLQSDMKSAMLAKDKSRLSAIRLIMAAIKKAELDNPRLRQQLQDGIEDETYILDLLTKLAKQCQESINQYKSAGRNDLVEKETADLKVVSSYLPPPLSEESVNTLIQKVIEDTQATTLKDMGKVMSALKPQLKGRADMGQVSLKIKQALGQKPA